jgi:hypothetical protein
MTIQSKAEELEQLNQAMRDRDKDDAMVHLSACRDRSFLLFYLYTR